MTVEQASRLILEYPGVGFSQRLFLVDTEGRLLGFVSSRSLIVSPPTEKLGNLIKAACHKVHPETSREEVVELVERYSISELPVVDKDNRFLGVISYEDIIEAIEDMADDTIACIAGTGEKVSEPESMLKKFFYRAPWLFVTLLAGLLNMSVMSIFQAYEGIVLTFVFFFVPLVTGMSGNIGLQCSTILVRNMALGLLSKEAKREMIVKEFSLGLFNGVFFGLLSGFFVYVINSQGISLIAVSPSVVGTIVGVGLFGACISGTLLGVFSPIIFSRMGVDPAVASGPIVTAFNDFLSMSIYFIISIILSNILLV